MPEAGKCWQGGGCARSGRSTRSALDVHEDLLWILTDTPLTSEPPGGPWGFTGFRVEFGTPPAS